MTGNSAQLNTVIIIIREYALEKELAALKLEQRAEKKKTALWYVSNQKHTGNPEEDRYYRLTWERGDVLQRLVFDPRTGAMLMLQITGQPLRATAARGQKKNSIMHKSPTLFLPLGDFPYITSLTSARSMCSIRLSWWMSIERPRRTFPSTWVDWRRWSVCFRPTKTMGTI